MVPLRLSLRTLGWLKGFRDLGSFVPLKGSFWVIRGSFKASFVKNFRVVKTGLGVWVPLFL